MIGLRNFVFKFLYGFRGYPLKFADQTFQVDASLRRWNTECEHEVREAISTIVRPGDCFVDIGANFGMHTLVAASIAEKVFAFEPMPENARLLRRHLKLNGIEDRVVVEEAAVSNCVESVVTMNSPDKGFDVVASLNPTFDSFVEIEVANTRLDDYAAFLERPPDVIKIDVEGAELDVLHGGTRLFKEVKPTILLEVHPQVDEAQVMDLLKKFGYKANLLNEQREVGREFHLICESA